MKKSSILISRMVCFNDHLSRYLLSIFIILLFAKCKCEESKHMSKEEILELREESRDMFYHAYNAYMENAYPADELMPLSCKGRFRGLTPNRGDIDDCLGNFSLTLIDTLDTLVVLGDLEEFEHAIKLVINNVSFDNDLVVSVFETNIRVLGGLLSAHVLASYLQDRDNILPWYKGELLDMAKDVGYRLLPAFNTSTGIPHARINMMYGLKSDKLESARETCTACAGSMILEMAALSRLTGEPIFEEKAQKAMDELWKIRHRSSDLMGTILNVHSGDWIRRDSGVGAGIDSYYEYCLKAYILLGDNKYLNRFNRHYNAIMKYISQGPMLLDVHMHRPHTNSRNFMDALLAFWPGLQVLKGDIKPAVETHEMLYQVMQRHKFIPEAFTTDFQVHWGNHPLRPEFLESTYYLYEATNDPYYLDVGKQVLKSLQRYARVPCGYAAVNDVRTGKQEDRMDSFVLSETFKYLYLLFTDKDDLILNLNEFIFTTEGHLLPLTLGGNAKANKSHADIEIEDTEFSRSCPNTLKLFPASFRKPLLNMVDGMCPKLKSRPRLTASEFSASNLIHLKMLKDMGINIVTLNDGRVQLLHTFSAARTSSDGEDGLLFMHEMVELSKIQTQQQVETNPQVVSFMLRDKIEQTEELVTIHAGPSQFGVNLRKNERIAAQAHIAQPFKACEAITNPGDIFGKIAIVERGDCMFVDKTRRAQNAGAVATLILDNVIGSNSATSPMFSMSGDGRNDIFIPAIFLFQQDASKLLLALRQDPELEVTIAQVHKDLAMRQKEEESMFQKLKMSVQEFLNKHTGISLTTTVSVGSLTAEIGSEKIRIVHDKTVKDKPEDFPLKKTKRISDTLWSEIRRDLLKTLLEKELYVPLHILQIYYQKLSGTPEQELQNHDIVRQTKWLLRELIEELHKSKDDSLIKAEKDVETSVLADLNKLPSSALKDSNSQRKNQVTEKTIQSILESVDELEKSMLKRSKVIKSVLNKLQLTTDDLTLIEGKSDERDIKESDEANETKSDSAHSESTEKDTTKSRTIDEL